MSRLWTKARRERKCRREEKKRLTLEYQLCEILSTHAGERGQSEGAVDTLCRIIHERDTALTILALDRLKEIPAL
jgi:hypothetical protein